MIHEGLAAIEGRLDAVIAASFPELSRSRARVLIEDGAVRVDGVVVTRPAAKVASGAALFVDVPAPAPAEAAPQDLPLRIVHEDADVVVIDKDPGMVVHPGPGHADGTLVNALLHHVEDLSGVGGVERPGIVHRLDRGTSGLLVVAKSDAAHGALSRQFADHTAGRRYLALCIGVPQRLNGTLHSWLARDPHDRLRFASVRGEGGREAITHWTVRAQGDGVALIECRLETGRTHQVRVHLCEAGWPLVGDPLYKRRGRQPPAALRPWLVAHPERPLLHAWQLGFAHPRTGEALSFTAPLPPDFREALAAVGIDDPLAR